MTFQLNDQELIQNMQDNLSDAFDFYSIGLKLSAIASYYKARAYQDEYYSLGYCSDDMPKEVIRLFAKFNKILIGLQVIEKWENTHSKEQ